MDNTQALQYNRKAQLLVQGSSIDAKDISALRFTFSIEKKSTKTPNTAEIKITNLSSETSSTIRNEFTRVVLSAGYESNFGVIFDGDIARLGFGREGNTDTFTKIFAADGYLAYKSTVANFTIKGQHELMDQLREVTTELKKKLIAGGEINLSNDVINHRGAAIFGMAHEHMSNISSNLNADWSIQDGRVVVYSKQGYRLGNTFVLNSKSGLVGVPEVTSIGIKARCLLNPLLQIGRLVQIDQADISRDTLATSKKRKTPGVGISATPSVDPDGVYVLTSVRHYGDTRGTEWFSEFDAVAYNATAAPNSRVSAQ